MLELQSELQQTESKLTELQSKRNDQSSLMLTPEQEQELKDFTAEKARVRKELRETQRGLDVDITRLENRLKVINIAIAPLAVGSRGALISVAAPPAQSRGSQARMSRKRFVLTADRRARRDLRRALSEFAAQPAADTPGAALLPDAGAASSTPSPRCACARAAPTRPSRCTIGAAEQWAARCSATTIRPMSPSCASC